MRTGGKSIPLGRIFGIPIGLDYSWFLIFALLVWSLSTNYYPARFGNWAEGLYWGVGVLTAVLLFVSVLLHELGHAVAALAFRIPVRRIRLLFFGGVAELGDEAPHAGGEFLVAIAGPAVSLLIAIVLGFGWLGMTLVSAPEPVIALVGYLAFINLILAVFNMLPGFPLDGGRVLRAVLWGLTGNLSRATRIAASIGRILAFGFIGFGILQILTGSLANGLWSGFIGMFLQGAASAEVQAQQIRDMLAGRTVGQVMRRSYATLPADVTVQQVLDAHILGFGNRSFVVTSNGEVVGILTLENVQRVPIEERWHTSVAQAMTPLSRAEPITPDTGLWDALRQMELEQLGQVPVVENGQIMGLLRRDDVFAFLYDLRRFGARYA